MMTPKRLGRELETGQKMAEIEQILKHQQRISAVLVEPVHLVQGVRRGAAQHALQQIQHAAPVGDAEHVTHGLFGDPRIGQCDRLIKQRQAVAHRTVGGTGE